ncbi:MAG: hypothetical protein HYX53_10555 [Chloroflexi bacterium]|nr:hypothetical protein [Chloroflexota bacterium]
MHSTVANKDGAGGDFKLYGRAVPATDEVLVRHMWQQVMEATGWNPSGPAHVFRLEIESCGFANYGGEAQAMAAGAKAAGLKPTPLGEDLADPDGMAVAWRPSGR